MKLRFTSRATLMLSFAALSLVQTALRSQTPMDPVAARRAQHLRHGINTSIWFAQAPGRYTVERLRTLQIEAQHRRPQYLEGNISDEKNYVFVDGQDCKVTDRTITYRLYPLTMHHPAPPTYDQSTDDSDEPSKTVSISLAETWSKTVLKDPKVLQNLSLTPKRPRI